MRCANILAQVLDIFRGKRRTWYGTLKTKPVQTARPATDDHSAELLRPYTPQHLTDTVFANHGTLKGEYKHVTVLFADLQGSTALAQAVGPEVLHEILNEVFTLMLEAVHGVGGTVNQFTGDGIMALFGAPVAHEDHAVRALHAALGIQRIFATYATKVHRNRGLTLALRLGLHTGLVVVGKTAMRYAWITPPRVSRLIWPIVYKSWLQQGRYT